VAGIGSPAAVALDAAPSVLETAVAAPVAAPVATNDTGLQVVNANSYEPSDTDLQTMGLSRDQWNEAMASFANIDTKLLSGLSLNMVGKNPDATNNYRVFTAPLSNKGNPTAYNNNSFTVIQGQPIRLVDMKTGKVVFQGTGYDAADKAIELAAGLTKAGGNKADWEIQTGQFKNPGSGELVFGEDFKTVANEKANKSIIPKALDVLGDAALGFIAGGPIGAAIAATASVAGVNVSDIAYPIIATMALGPLGITATVGATMGAAALGSAVSSTIQGRSLEETLIRAGVTGLTAGVMQGTDIGGEISRSIGSALNDIGVQSQVGDIVNSITDAVSGIGSQAATQEIIVNAATNAATAALVAGSTGSAVSSAIVDAVKNFVPDYQPSAETEAALKGVDNAAAAANEIVVTGNLSKNCTVRNNCFYRFLSSVSGVVRSS
jgi:hypothetical protein